MSLLITGKESLWERQAYGYILALAKMLSDICELHGLSIDYEDKELLGNVYDETECIMTEAAIPEVAVNLYDWAIRMVRDAESDME